MAAAALAPSRGLFLTVTLLCLVCRSSSLMNEQKLEQLREGYRKAKGIVDKLKVDYQRNVDFSSELITQFVSSVDPLIAEVKETVESLPDDFPPAHIHMGMLKEYVLGMKADVDKMLKELSDNIKVNEKKLGQLKKCIQFYEAQQAEL